MKYYKMRITVCASIFALLFAFTFKAEAQMGEIGLRFMPTFSALDVKTIDGGTVKGELTIGYGGGLLLGYNFSEHVGLQTEIIYTSLSQKYVDQGAENIITLNYINIPLLLSLNTGKFDPVNFNFVVGPQIGLNTGGDVSTSGGNGSTTVTAVVAVKKGNLGFAYGAGVDFGVNEAHTLRIGLGFRGVFGLIDISESSGTTETDEYYVLAKNNLKTYSAYIGISYLF
jgi:hypothetical protein